MTAGGGRPTGLLGELRDKAGARLDPVHRDFFEGGAGRETALAENERAFRRLALLPRVLRGAGPADTAVTLLGERAALPVVVSPTAFHRLAHPDGELATARATAAAGTVLITSMASTTAVAEVTAAARAVRADAAVWFQLYLQPAPEVTDALVRRAEQAGCGALVVTVDSPVLGRRPRDERNGFHDLPPGFAAENMRGLPGGPPGGTRDIAMSPGLSWDDLRRLREGTALPVVLKGVLHPDDARRAADEGVAALMVSNHGGRQLDAAPAAVEALPPVVAAVGGRLPVLLDGGVRTGSDVVVALALGAAAVGIGRPVLWGLAAGGEDGVAGVLEELRAEVAQVMTLCGARNSGDLSRDQVVVRGPGDGGVLTARRIAVAAVALSTPYWLPKAVVGLRVKVFARVNGPEGVVVPDDRVDADRFAELYAHPAADGRSRGAGLSDLFWYWLAPGPEVHQEHLEPGPRYDAVARTTSAILAGTSAGLTAAATRCAAAVLDELVPGDTALVRLRDLMMPVWAEFFYELVFREPCPAPARPLIVDNAEDVVNSLKNTRLRHLDRRARLTRYLVRRLAAGEVPHELPAELTTLRDRAHYLQGAFFNTAVVQMSEAMAHLLLVLAQQPGIQRRLAEHPDDEHDLGNVMNETLRRYPLFGIAHRITSADIDLGGGIGYPAGTVLCFDYPAYHAAGYPDPERFDPERWDHLAAKDAHHIPFGVAANRPCPAWRLAPLVMRAVTREVLARFTLHSSVSHTRAIPHRAPCLLVARDRPLPRHRVGAVLAFLRLRDRWEDVGRSLLQFGFGTWMVLDARRTRPAGRYFDRHDTQGRLLDGGGTAPDRGGLPPPGCPYHR